MMMIAIRTVSVAVMILLISVTATSAQSVEGGVKFGVNRSSIPNAFVLAPATSDAVGPSIALTVGAFAHFGGARVRLQPEMILTSYGADLSGDSESTEEDGTDTTSRTISLRYLEVPVLVRWQFPSQGTSSAYVLAGPSFGFRMRANLRTTTADSDPQDESIDERVASSTVGMAIGAGLQGSRWLLEGRWVGGLTNLAIDNDADTVHTRAVLVLLGIRF